MLYFGQRQFPKSRKVFLTFMSTYEDQDQGPDNGELEAHVSSSVKGVTLQHVALAAGVTLGTASKAINGRGKLSLETRERVAQRSPATRLSFSRAGTECISGPACDDWGTDLGYLRALQSPVTHGN